MQFNQQYTNIFLIEWEHYKEVVISIFFSQFIYPSPEDSENDVNGEQSNENTDGKYEHFASMNNVVVDKVKRIMEEESSDGIE